MWDRLYWPTIIGPRCCGDPALVAKLNKIEKNSAWLIVDVQQQIFAFLLDKQHSDIICIFQCVNCLLKIFTLCKVYTLCVYPQKLQNFMLNFAPYLIQPE